MNYAQTSLYFILLPVIGITGVEVRVAPVILSGTILKSSIALILTFKIVMGKSTLKIGTIPQKSEWLASLHR